MFHKEKQWRSRALAGGARLQAGVGPRARAVPVARTGELGPRGAFAADVQAWTGERIRATDR